MSANFPVNTFYSNKKSKRLLELEVKLEHGVTESNKRPLPPILTSSLLGHSIDWKIFHKQAEALNYAKQRGLGLMTFAFEEQITGNEGRRKFVVTHPVNMWKNHIVRPPDKRCSYEVIPMDTKCKLYFDLEFSKHANPASDGNKMVETLLAASFWAFEDIYQLKVTKSDVLVLDASNTSKFSQHLIFQSCEFAFQDNYHVGNFVKYLMAEVKECRVPEVDVDEQRNLFVKNEKGESVSFCDLSVYTKNRNFRIFLASKFEKRVPLVLAQTNNYRPNRICYINDDWPTVEAAFFSASLITYFGNCQSGKRFLTFGSNTCKEVTSTECSKHRTSLDTKDPSLNGYSASPWIEIDRFIEGLVAPVGTIRQWVYFENTETIIYHIHGSRFCSSIGREHKSNHIKYVVNIPNATYYQSCFDPICCAKSRPLPQPIPLKHLPWINLLTDSPSFNTD